MVTNFNISQNFHHFLDYLLPYSNTCHNFRDSRDSIRLISFSKFFFLFLSVAVRGRPLRGRSASSMCLSLKCCTHGLIVLYTLQPCANILWRNSLLQKKFYHSTLPQLSVITNHTLALKYDHVTGDSNMILILL